MYFIFLHVRESVFKGDFNKTIWEQALIVLEINVKTFSVQRDLKKSKHMYLLFTVSCRINYQSYG